MASVAPIEQPDANTEMDDMAQKPSTDSGPAILTLKEDGNEEESPPLTYIDFIPQCFGSKIPGSEPKYATFQSVVEQANQWLREMPQFNAVKCETVDHKLNPTDFSLDPDQVLQHISSNGKNIFLKGLRMWLMPRTDSSAPTQQLAYITVLPDHSTGSVATAVSQLKPTMMLITADQIFAEYDSMTTTMNKLNHHLQQKPLPGKILTVETLPIKVAETERNEKLDTEATLWSESGKATRYYLFATRIFYVVGQPAHDTIGFYDQVPEFVQNPDGMGLRIKFAPFSHAVTDAAQWLKTQHNTRVVNFQSVTFKAERMGNSPYKLNPEAPGFAESQNLEESRYVKVLRIYYVKDSRPDAPALYTATEMTSRLFVPTQTVPYTRSFETFSKNMQRVISWLNATGTPVLGMETVCYKVAPETEAAVNGDRVDSVVNTHCGRHRISCVRLYFATEFQEPPPEVVPETSEDSWGWACVVS